MLPRIEYSVVVPVPVGPAFRAFCDLGRLLHRGIYEEASWIEGKPWQVGSRVRYVVTSPVQGTISGVVTSSDPPRSVSLLNHALGVTVEEQVAFDPAPNGSTLVRMTMEFVGESPGLSAEVVRQTIVFYARDALDTMADLCRQRSSTSSLD